MEVFATGFDFRERHSMAVWKLTMEISSLSNLPSSGVQKRHAEMLESEGTSRMRAQVPFLPPTKGGMVSINLFRRIPNQCENTIDSSAHCYRRQQLRCKNLSLMAARID